MLDDRGVIDNAMSSGTDVARPRADSRGPRSARCLGDLRAHLRRLHHGARARVGACGGERARHRGAAKRRDHPQHHVPDAVRAGPRDPLLSPARARLGGHCVGAEGRPQGDGRAGADGLAVVAHIDAGLFHRRSEHRQEIRRVRPTRHLCTMPTGAIPRTSCRRRPT